MNPEVMAHILTSIGLYADDITVFPFSRRLAMTQIVYESLHDIRETVEQMDDVQIRRVIERVSDEHTSSR